MATYSTLDAARTAYLANSDYADGSGDVTKARAFRSACKALLILMPAMAVHGLNTIQMSLQNLKAELDSVNSWLAQNDLNQADQTTRVLVANFELARDPNTY